MSTKDAVPPRNIHNNRKLRTLVNLHLQMVSRGFGESSATNFPKEKNHMQELNQACTINCSDVKQVFIARYYEHFKLKYQPDCFIWSGLNLIHLNERKVEIHPRHICRNQTSRFCVKRCKKQCSANQTAIDDASVVLQIFIFNASLNSHISGSYSIHYCVR